MNIEGGKYLVARFEVKPDEYEEAWNWVYNEWFPKSGYQPNDGPGFEMYPGKCETDKTLVDICVPVKPL
jgi:AraC family transcriptional regulator